MTTSTIPRIRPLTDSEACPKQQELLHQVKKSVGAVPNLISTLAHSPAAAKAYLAFSQSLAGGLLDGPLRERLALAVGEKNQCRYCVSAHSMLGSKAGLSKSEIDAARRGTSSDPKVAEALRFARQVLETHGHISEDDWQGITAAGYCEGEVVELVAHVALNFFTNTLNHVAGTEIDFPLAPDLAS
ncbi:MAG: carboxymuconolactone decarboxylase family protein [Blastochloris sp.]|nr:carboxymuconolactone decarboxylase family protein [Blastochloris sp.]